VESVFKNLLCISGLDPVSAYNSLDLCVSFESSQDRVTIKQRLDDIRGNNLRSKLFDVKQDSENLHVKLGTQINSRFATVESEFVRANELFRKTNQFNVTLARSIIDSNDLMNSPIVAICEMRDSISDSGIISSILLNSNSNEIEILEFVISCRALGRNVEKYIFRSLLESITETFWLQHIVLIPNFGPKNVPAIEFVNNYFGVENGRYFLLSDKLIDDTEKHFDQINKFGEL
jgi:FkbH-like protein